MWRNRHDSFGWVQIGLHWLLAAVFIALFAIGLYMRDLGYYDPGYQVWPVWHKTIGIVGGSLMLLRLIWRQSNPRVVPIERGIQQQLATAVHALLYVLVFVLCISGYLMASADGNGIELIGEFTVPGIGEFDEEQVDTFNYFHEWPAWGLMALAAMHAAAAFYHHWYLKDATLKRMIRPTNSRNSKKTQQY